MTPMPGGGGRAPGGVAQTLYTEEGSAGRPLVPGEPTALSPGGDGHGVAAQCHEDSVFVPGSVPSGDRTRRGQVSVLSPRSRGHAGRAVLTEADGERWSLTRQARVREEAATEIRWVREERAHVRDGSSCSR